MYCFIRNCVDSHLAVREDVHICRPSVGPEPANTLCDCAEFRLKDRVVVWEAERELSVWLFDEESEACFLTQFRAICITASPRGHLL